MSSSPTETAAPSLEDELEMMGIPRGSYEVKPLDGVRRTVARRLTEAARDVPHFALNAHLRLGALLDRRKTINAAADEAAKVSVNDMLVKAAALALADVPEANASFTSRGIILHKAADIAVAVAIEGGLITPIVRDAGGKSVAEIGVAVRDLADRARRRRLKPDEYTGGTFCISNLGMFGVSSFTSILNPPQGAILSVGAGEERVIVENGQPAVATVLTVTLTCDHRVIDGAVGARWLAAFRQHVEAPAAIR